MEHLLIVEMCQTSLPSNISDIVLWDLIIKKLWCTADFFKKSTFFPDNKKKSTIYYIFTITSRKHELQNKEDTTTVIYSYIL
jgi:hypothetical protein